MTITPYIWCVPYLRLRPSHCFVVDDGGGDAVGYILCAPNTASFVGDYKSKYIPVLESLDPRLRKPRMDPPALLLRIVFPFMVYPFWVLSRSVLPRRVAGCDGAGVGAAEAEAAETSASVSAPAPSLFSLLSSYYVKECLLAKPGRRGM